LASSFSFRRLILLFFFHLLLRPLSPFYAHICSLFYPEDGDSAFLKSAYLYNYSMEGYGGPG
jgi:hypothetical protein